MAGNYYSIRGEHEKAVLSFQRALKLNRKCDLGIYYAGILNI